MSTVQSPRGTSVAEKCPADPAERMRLVIGFAADGLPANLSHEVRQLLDPATLGQIVGVLTVVSVAHLTPIGWIADFTILGLGVTALGMNALDAADELGRCLLMTHSAKSHEDLRVAGRHLSRLITLVGVNVFLAVLARRSPSMRLPLPALRGFARTVALDAKGREVALYFGSGEGISASKIPPIYATLDSMLKESEFGRILKAHLERLNWKQVEPLWWELSDRVANLGAKSGKRVHVFVPESYYKAMFPDAEELQNWWARNRGRLERGGRTWDQAGIEAQYYAEHRTPIGTNGKVRIGADGRERFEDEIFHKIESLNLRGAEFHVLNEHGVEVRKWYQNF